MEMFHLLFNHFGPQKWWPGDTALEMMVGAVLTQNTNWKNVEKAVANLKRGDLLSLGALHRFSAAALAEEIRPAGYYNIKAKRLKNLVAFIVDRHGPDLTRFLSEEPRALRKGLLSISGIGPETADSILLYAAHLPVFAIDTYTYRILVRHGMCEEEANYDQLQTLFMDHLPDDPALFNEFHALIVRTGKAYCKKKPSCQSCPLRAWGPLPSPNCS